MDLSLLAGEYVAGVNSVLYATNLSLNFYFTVSNKFWMNHVDAIKNVKCERRFIVQELRDHLDSSTPTSWLRGVYERHLPHESDPFPYSFSSRSEEIVFLGGTVLLVAFQVLARIGFSRLILLGVDHDYGFDLDQTARTGFSGRELAKFMASVQAAVYGSHEAELTPAIFENVLKLKLAEHRQRVVFAAGPTD